MRRVYFLEYCCAESIFMVDAELFKPLLIQFKITHVINGLRACRDRKSDVPNFF